MIFPSTSCCYRPKLFPQLRQVAAPVRGDEIVAGLKARIAKLDHDWRESYMTL